MRMLEILALQGCKEFIFATKGMENCTRLKEAFRFGKGFFSRLGIKEGKIKYQPKYDDKGNADALRYCMEFYDIKQEVLVVSGDNIVDISYRDMVEYHKEKNALLTVGLKEIEGDVSQYGVAVVDEELRLRGFVEKPKRGEEPSKLINTSLYVFSPEVREILADMGEKAQDIGRDVVPYLVKRGYDVYGYPIKGYWADIGTPSTYLQTTIDVLSGKVKNIKFNRECHFKNNTWIHPTTVRRLERKDVGESLKLEGNVFIGGDCEIDKNVYIKDSCIGDNCIIQEGSKIINSIVMDFTNIERNSTLNKCIVGRYVTIRENSVIDGELSVDIGEKDPVPVIGDGVIILKNSIIGPAKRVAPVQKSHMILETQKYVELGYDSYNVYFTEK